MSTKIFVNLPVSDLDRSVAFFSKLGFTFDPRFTDQNATCMIVGKDSFVMLLVHDFFKSFTTKQISDAAQSTEVIVSLSLDRKEAVDEMIQNAVAAGGVAPKDPTDENGMYQWGFSDLDGHLWEVFYMDPTLIPPPQ